MVFRICNGAGFSQVWTPWPSSGRMTRCATWKQSKDAQIGEHIYGHNRNNQKQTATIKFLIKNRKQKYEPRN